MPEFLENPRRGPREPVRCRANVVVPSGRVETTTEDIGTRGCQVVLPAAPQRGATITLTLSAPRVPGSLRIEGRVAWVSPQPPWRVGVAYTPAFLTEAGRWMAALRQVSPELFGGARRVHERVALDAMVYLGAAPRLADFSEEELAVLGTIGLGLRVTELRAAHSRSWPRSQRAFFALLAQGFLTLSRAAAVHPVTWKAILGEPETVAPAAILSPADLVELIEPSPSPTPPPRTAGTALTPPPDSAARAARAGRATQPATAVPPPLPSQQHGASESAAPTRPAVDPGRRNAPPAPDFVGAGVGWRAGNAKPRTGEADTLFQLAIVELQQKNHHQALKLLRSALTLAPGDKEIAEAIARAMGGR
jgi:hypothetical protein